MSTQTKTGHELISIERQRQLNAEGWTPEHDDAHKDGELLDAAGCYAFVAQFQRTQADTCFDPLCDLASEDWPWEMHWWKPSKDPIRNLVKAGALIAAEIDRLARDGAAS